MVAIKNKQEKTRFGIVGIVNTALDFGILFFLTILGLPTIASNYISTSIAVIFSFVANKKYTFQSSGRNLKREISLFLIFTLIGVWVLQPVTIFFVEKSIEEFNFSTTISIFIAKLVATLVSLIWNYSTYSRFVFTNNPQERENG